MSTETMRLIHTAFIPFGIQIEFRICSIYVFKLMLLFITHSNILYVVDVYNVLTYELIQTLNVFALFLFLFLLISFIRSLLLSFYRSLCRLSQYV